MKAIVRLKLDVAMLKYWKNLVVGLSLIPKIRKMTLLKVNCEIDSVVASKNETFLLNFSSSFGNFGISFPENIAFQHLTICLRTLSLQRTNVQLVAKLIKIEIQILTQKSKGKRRPLTISGFQRI